MSGEQPAGDPKFQTTQEAANSEQRYFQRLLDRSLYGSQKKEPKVVVQIKPIIIPGMEFRPAEDSGRAGGESRSRAASGGLAPTARDFDRDFGETEDDDLGDAERASDTNYEKLFAHRGEFSESFDFVYGEHGRIVGAIRPQEDADAEKEREEVAGRYAESEMRAIEKRIGSKIEQADTSGLHNDESILQRVKKIVLPQPRRVIHDDGDI